MITPSILGTSGSTKDLMPDGNAPERIGEVQLNVSRAEALAEELKRIKAVLRGKLRPITSDRNVQPPEAGTVSGLSPARCEIGGRIDAVLDVMRADIEDTRELIEALEV